MMTSPPAGKKLLKPVFIVFAFVFLVAESAAGWDKGNAAILNILSGRFNPALDEAYSVVPAPYATQANMYLHQKTLDAFSRMAAEAKKSGFDIYINSALRDFSSQKYIWESKFNGQRLVEGKNLKKTIPDERLRALKILEYSSMPGTSRHHWGTDVDLGFTRDVNHMLTNSAYESKEGLRFYNWMQTHAADFGFCQPYKDSPSKRNPGIRYGYNEEKWHWSYMPLSSEYLREYLANASKFIPEGFAGSLAGEKLYLDFVQNIHPDCR